MAEDNRMDLAQQRGSSNHDAIDIVLRTLSWSGRSRTEAVLEAFARAAGPLLNWNDYRGRNGRRSFWSFLLFSIGAVLVGRIMDLFVFWSVPGGVPVFFIAIHILILLPSLAALGVRRLHDAGHSGWLLLLCLIPVAGWIALVLFWMLPTRNEYRPQAGRR